MHLQGILQLVLPFEAILENGEGLVHISPAMVRYTCTFEIYDDIFQKLAKLKGKAAKIVRRKKKNRILLGLEDSTGETGESNASRKNKRKKEGEGLQESYQLDLKDPRFTAIYERNEFAIDPTNPKYKKTKAMEEVLEERRKRRVGEGSEERRKKKAKR